MNKEIWNSLSKIGINNRKELDDLLGHTEFKLIPISDINLEDIADTELGKFIKNSGYEGSEFIRCIRFRYKENKNEEDELS